MVEINERLVGILKRGGADKVADMDELFKREALDVIGRPGHSKGGPISERQEYDCSGPGMVKLSKAETRLAMKHWDNGSSLSLS